MSSKRNLKKTIDYSVYEVINDCYTYLYLYPEKNPEKVIEIVDKAIRTKTVLIQKTNSKVKRNTKESKSLYKSINSELYNIVTESFNKLSDIIKE